MKRSAIYAGTFDPITFGHVDIVERASKIFEQVIVGVALNPGKKPLFSLPERVALTTQVLHHVPNVKVLGFETLTLDFAKQLQATVLIRGIRAVLDFDYEFQLANMNRTLYPEMETLFLMPAEKYMFISSSLIREIASLKGDIVPFVPPLVADAIVKKMQ
jgi:pantetheine-phosphate adenylyltransferase